MSADDRTPQSAAGADPVRTYVSQLAVALDGCDPAIRHDALVDAEVHLRSAVAAGTPAERAIAEFGTPAEVARAYRESGGGASVRELAWPLPSMQPPSAPPDATARHGLAAIPVIGVWAQPEAWGGLLYFGLLSLPLATAYFAWSMTLGVLALGSAPLVIGVPILVLLLASTRGISLFEGKLVERLLRVRMPRRTQPVVGSGTIGFWKRMGCWLRDVRSWMSLGYLVGILPVSTLLFAVTCTLCSVSVSFLAAPIIYLIDIPIARLPAGSDAGYWLFGTLVPDATGRIMVPGTAVLPCFLAGVALATATLWLMRGFGWIYGRVVQAIQVARPQ